MSEQTTAPAQPRVSAKAMTFTESVIRDMTRLALAHGAVNLAQGFPDFACPPELKEAAKAAIDADVNQYAITWGAAEFRAAVAAKVGRTYPGWSVDPDTEICVTCGSTEAMIATMLALVDPGDEVIMFEPFYENYGPDTILSGARPRLVRLHAPDWSIDPAELRAAFSDRTRAIVLNTPHNPTGKVLRRDELELVAELCQRHDALVFTDEIYEHIHYLGPGGHIPPATVPGLEDRTVTINALSKTYAVTGWRVGWTIAPPAYTSAIRKVHDFLTVGAAAPLQAGGVAAMGLPPAYYDGLAEQYRARRDLLCAALTDTGFTFRQPDGAYYVMCDTRAIDPGGDDVALARRLVTEIGVATVPGSSFFADPADGRHIIRFGFPKKLSTLQAAADRLARLGRPAADG
ncbi:MULTISPECIES: pyridoxal phosphate-dependent aminotransferase [Frankia]|uniref:Transaminase n=1 Tax=Frankia alni (strain DSM 45986 / CECT 9034 / ACN14a) TaxID=326424 RepID=Q0RCY4_FRAAA|nr:MULTISPECIES: aminotransferase class I/II-fold pyridoxal phosphate-dependent enzyme [Frankia]CAJ64690.1 putative transaminase [Frankia alni ACN14a]